MKSKLNTPFVASLLQFYEVQLPNIQDNKQSSLIYILIITIPTSFILNKC